jgi:hypothetical protein
MPAARQGCEQCKGIRTEATCSMSDQDTPFTLSNISSGAPEEYAVNAVLFVDANNRTTFNTTSRRCRQGRLMIVKEICLHWILCLIVHARRAGLVLLVSRVPARLPLADIDLDWTL